MNERTTRTRQPRPHYFTREQLDELCENIIFSFCLKRYGQQLTPIPTEALLQLLDQHVQHVDQLAELPEGRRGALAAEIERRGIFERAIGASQAERSSTLPAELHAGWILKFALRIQSPRFSQTDT
jgi:hypothetical protein